MFVLAGVLTEEYLREIMTTMGDRWTDEMVDELLHGAPISVSVMCLKSVESLYFEKKPKRVLIKILYCRMVSSTTSNSRER